MVARGAVYGEKEAEWGGRHCEHPFLENGKRARRKHGRRMCGGGGERESTHGWMEGGSELIIIGPEKVVLGNSPLKRKRTLQTCLMGSKVSGLERVYGGLVNDLGKGSTSLPRTVGKAYWGGGIGRVCIHWDLGVGLKRED